MLTLWSFISDSEWNSSRIKTIKHMKSLILLPSQFLSDHSINRLHTRCVWTLSSMTTSTEWCISSRHEMCKQMSIQLKTLIVSCQLLFILFFIIWISFIALDPVEFLVFCICEEKSYRYNVSGGRRMLSSRLCDYLPCQSPTTASTRRECEKELAAVNAQQDREITLMQCNVTARRQHKTVIYYISDIFFSIASSRWVSFSLSQTKQQVLMCLLRCVLSIPVTLCAEFSLQLCCYLHSSLIRLWRAVAKP